MMPEITALLNPSSDMVGDEEHSYNIKRITALHELRLARKVSLELIRDCPEDIQARVGDAFTEAIKELT
jgi:hypothetical protein